ncbi:MAG: RteC domain-containing protein [Bacteroidota bacterium]
MNEETELQQQILAKLTHLEELITEFIIKPISDNGEMPSVNWTLSKTDLIELIYALHSGGAFNKGTASIAQITRFFESVLHIQLGNTSMTFQEILRRKDSTAFLERLKEKLGEHINNIDEQKFR